MQGGATCWGWAGIERQECGGTVTVPHRLANSRFRLEVDLVGSRGPEQEGAARSILPLLGEIGPALSVVPRPSRKVSPSCAVVQRLEPPHSS